MNNWKQVQTILILSSWSSGSTAVTGFLEKSGCYVIEPCFSTNDPRTPNSFEPVEYREALLECIDERTFKLKKPKEKFLEFFSKWYTHQERNCRDSGYSALVLKHPLQAFFLDQIFEVCTPKIVVVTRPFHLIEKTRLRRMWHDVYGISGAKILYSVIYSYLQNKSLTYLPLPYEELRKNSNLQELLLNFCSISPTIEQRESAIKFIRR